jgi:prophage antirepressor-like protein
MEEIIFKSISKEIRTLLFKEKFSFIASDVFNILNFENSKINEIPDSEKLFIDKLNEWSISEKILYQILFESESYPARNFSNWIQSELNSSVDTILKTLLPTHIEFTLEEDGRFELKNKIALEKKSTFKFFDSIAPSKIPKNKKIGTLTENETIWFNAKDVCILLNLVGHTLHELEPYVELKKIENQFFVNQEGLIHLIFSSNNKDSFYFAKLLREKIIPEDKIIYLNFYKSNSKKSRNKIKHDLKEYVSIQADGTLLLKENCLKQNYSFKLFNTYPF